MAQYSRAPIKEAILDVRVSGDPISVWTMENGLRELQERYPERQEIIGGPSFELATNPADSPFFNFGPILTGVRYSSTDGSKRVQTRLDGFSFNSLAPYKDWETFGREARRNWDIYVENRAPQFVTRLGLRYVNQFLLPSETEKTLSISDFFVLAPVWDTTQLGNSEGFNLQMAFPYPLIGATLLLTQATVPSDEGLSILLDIDVFCEGLRLEAADVQGLWNRAEQLRDLKNQVFEACLKDKGRLLIL